MNRWCSPALVTVLLLCFRLGVLGDQYGDFEYASDGESITITGYTGAGGDVVIPGNIDGIPVTGIGQAAFAFATPY
jgi:hypothetical protein